MTGPMVIPIRKMEEAIDQAIELIAVDDLKVDAEYQRDVDEDAVRLMFESFDSRLFRPIEVARRADGTVWVVDGQHRLMLALMRKMTHVVARVHDVKTPAAEARLFLDFNGSSTAVRAWSKFRAGVKAGDEVPTQVHAIVYDLGLRLAEVRRDFAISAVRALETVHTKHKNLRRTLELLTGWCDGKPDVYDGDTILGFGSFLAAHPTTIDRRMVSVLRNVAPRELKRRIRLAKDNYAFSRTEATHHVLREIYNYKRGKIPRLLPPSAAEE